MRVFLHESITGENPFKEEIREELQNRVIETLKEFGECAAEEIRLYGKKIFVYDPESLGKEEDRYVLQYNRLEEDSWEPSYMGATLENFGGIRARAFGSGIGFDQHYMAMAVSRVLCECYSDGKYCVSGAIGQTIIYKSLAYIGMKYGIDLVEKFIDHRINLEIIENRTEEMDSIYLGIRGYGFYSKMFRHSESKKWKWYMEERFRDDLKSIESGDDYLYNGTEVYLASILMKYICEHELRDKMNLKRKQLLSEIRAFIKKYFINAVESDWQGSVINEDEFDKYEELKNSYIQKLCHDKNEYIKVACNKDLFYKSICNIIESENRNDGKEILNDIQIMLDEMVPSMKIEELKKKNMSKWVGYWWLNQEDTEERKKELMDSVREIIDGKGEPFILYSPIRYLREIEINYAHTMPISSELKTFLETIFSAERQNRYREFTLKNGCDGAACDNHGGAQKLLSIAENLYNESRILLASKLFYRLLEGSYSDKGVEKINKLEFYIEDLSEENQKKVFLWALQDEELCRQYQF